MCNKQRARQNFGTLFLRLLSFRVHSFVAAWIPGILSLSLCQVDNPTGALANTSGLQSPKFQTFVAASRSTSAFASALAGTDLGVGPSCTATRME